MMDEIGVDPKKLIAAAPEVLSQSFEGMKKLRIA
jgi:hypothetical protein